VRQPRHRADWQQAHMVEDYSFGSWIRRRRRALDLTQQELARRVNCSLSTIVKIEGDQRRPSRQIAELLAQHLSIPENQVGLFLKVARGLKPVDQIPPLPTHLPPLTPTAVGTVTCILPVPPTPLVGRKPELAEVIRLLTLPDCRLLTIAGLGGIGKTRLALQVIQDLNAASPPDFPDGVCFVSLASVMAIENVPKAIARAIGFPLSGPLSPEDQLLGHLQRKRSLLLLDNTEHLLEGAGIFAGILEHAPGVKLLVTSRERLNLRSEWVFDLQGLPVPPLEADDELEEYSAAKLFLDRARQVQNDFSLQEKDRPIVADICRMLDGIPLGIELAAAWVRTLPLGEIAAEIAHDLDFLTTSARDVPERHRSLRVVFDHSWSLLPSSEQRALRQLSVFQGGFSREAARQVAEIDLRILDNLIDKSLVRRSESARYDLHELARGYAGAHLAKQPDEEVAVQERHSRFFLSLVRGSGRDLHSSRQGTALARLSPEMANIRSAWTWALAHDQIELLGQAAQSLWYLFELLNYYREGEALFGHSADVVRWGLEGQQAESLQADRDRYAGARGKFLMYQAYFAMRLGRVDQAETLCQASISSLRSVHDPEALAHALTYYAVLNWTTGKLDRARGLLEESLPLSKEHGPPWQTALFTGIMGSVAYERGEYEHSFKLLSEALDRSQIIGDPRLTGFIAAYLGRTALKLQRTAEIEDILWEGAQATRESGDRFGHGLILEQLALAAQARGDFTSSEQLFEASVDLFREIGDAWYLARALTSWGDFGQSLGKLSRAAEHFRQAIRLSLDARAFLVALNALVGLAGVYAQEDKAEAALEIASRILEHPASPQEAKAKASRIQSDLVSRLAPEAVEAAYQRAHTQTLEDFVRINL
jgi:predicted ATPase/transcriptional regulator with XRE-family HTH domain